MASCFPTKATATNFEEVRKRCKKMPNLRLDEPYKAVSPYIQASPSRQQNLVKHCEHLERREILGAVVECGVLDGGTAAVMVYAMGGSKRKVHLFDTWRGLPRTTVKDGAESEKNGVGQSLVAKKELLQ